MSNEHKPETVLTPNKGTGPVASAWKVMENTETETGSNRQLADAGLLGVCIVFLATMLSLSQKKIDTPLIVALVTFAAAIPMLACGFMFAAYKVKPETGSLVLKAILITAWIVEGLGELAVAAGVGAVVYHISQLAFGAFIASIILVIVSVFFLSFVGLFIYAMRQIQREKQAAPASPTANLVSVDQSNSTTPTSSTPVMVELPPQTSGR